MRKKQSQNEIAEDQCIIEMPMEEVMHNSMLPYAEHVIMERAVPRVEDGLKPVQRRILYTMNELAIMPETPHRKCARIVGDCLGKYHPHGDSSVYDALVRLAQDFSMREKLVDGHGNFGSVDGDGAAAMRYTEARMAPLAVEMLRDLDKETVPYHLNFDDTLKEPDMLPASFPNLLVNGASGIAVGLATNIPTHNLNETIQAVIALIDDPDLSVDELMKIIPGPDFPTGGILLDTPDIRDSYETGKGKLILRCKTHIEDGTAGRKLIVITEIPYQVNKAAMLEKIQKLSEDKKAALGCIYDIRDESDRTGMRAVIELKKEADPDKVLAYLFKYSDMQITFGVNMVAIADGKPRLLSLKRAIRYYIRHRKNVVTARTEYDLGKAKARAHILEGLMIAVDNLDEVIRLIRKSENAKAAKIALVAAFQLTEIQAQAILDMRLQRLTNLEVLTLKKEYEDLCKQIQEYESILASEKKLMNVIKKELKSVAQKFGTERRTQIVGQNEVVEAAQKEEIIPLNATITFSESGVLRRYDPLKLKRSMENDEAVPEKLLYQFDVQTDYVLYFFTNLGNCYPLGVVQLPESTRAKDKGMLLSSLLPGLDEKEKPVRILCCRPSEMDKADDLFMTTKNGQVKRTALNEFNVRSKRFVAMILKDGDEILSVSSIPEDRDVLLMTRNGMCIRFHGNEVNSQGRNAAGVKGIAMEIGDKVVWSGIPGADEQLVIFTDRGFAKRMPLLEIESQARGGKGAKCFQLNRTHSNGNCIAGAALVPSTGAALQIHQIHSGITEVHTDEIPVQNRIGKGVPIVMALMDDIVNSIGM